MLNMISHQGNATQNHSEILLHVHRMTERKSKVLVRVVEKLELSYISGGCCNCFGKRLAVSLGLNIELPSDPAILFLGATEACVHTKTCCRCSQQFIHSSQAMKQPKYASIDEE